MSTVTQRAQGRGLEAATHVIPRNPRPAQHRAARRAEHADEGKARGAVAQDIEFQALEGSLSMMRKVLNDVLELSFASADQRELMMMSPATTRMDSARFESVLKPCRFHQVMRSLFVPLLLATDAGQLEFIIDLDTSIDDVRYILRPIPSVIDLPRMVELVVDGVGVASSARRNGSSYGAVKQRAEDAEMMAGTLKRVGEDIVDVFVYQVVQNG